MYNFFRFCRISKWTKQIASENGHVENAQQKNGARKTVSEAGGRNQSVLPPQGVCKNRRVSDREGSLAACKFVVIHWAYDAVRFVNT